MRKKQAAHYRRIGGLMFAAGTLAATDVPMLEATARILAELDDAYADETATRGARAALERLHKEQLIQLGLTPASRRTVHRAEAPPDAQSDRLRGLLA
ncbi:MAG: hypothetical protein WCK73_07920 [Deltaproteobacteria bacterium]